ncbi:MAG: glycosyltransferase family 2 protein [Prevotella sp.]|nr:glycosyltransferase family 2 protein [Candidatus Prevotella equi]
MNKPLVSVIVPNYRHHKFLEQRLDSILNQTYQEIEVIIIDDCSNDNGASKEIIERYRNNEKVSNIIYNSQNSGNTFVQWDKGIELAKGEIIWIAESDDFCERNMLETLVQQFTAHKDSAIAYTTYILVNEEGEKISKRKIKNNQHYSGEHYIKHYLLLGNIIRNASTAIFSRKAAVNIKKDYINYIGSGDLLFWIELAKQGSVSIINQQLSYFRQHNNKVTNRKDADGSNLLTERIFFDRIAEEFNISPCRKYLAIRFRRNKIKNTPFDNIETRKHIEDTWSITGTQYFLGTILYRLFKTIRSLTNYYI